MKQKVLQVRRLWIGFNLIQIVFNSMLNMACYGQVTDLPDACAIFQLTDPQDICNVKFEVDWRDSDGRPVGGKFGYEQLVDPDEANLVVQNKEELLDALENAPGDVPYVIYIADEAEIVINDLYHIPIKGGVTLASGRGRTCGALITTSTYGAVVGQDWHPEFGRVKSLPLFKVDGPNVRITGIRFQGPSTEVGDYSYLREKYCVKNGGDFYEEGYGWKFESGYPDFLIDNCEFFDWPLAAIGIGGSERPGLVIRNNLILNNRQEGFGYGVMIEEQAFARVTGNYFVNNRHDISAEGRIGSGYEASYNLSCPGINADFDSHGGRDFNGTGEESDVAGSFMHIHHNRFYGKEEEHIILRGVPSYMTLIENNYFSQSYEDAIRQGVSLTNYQKNVFSWNNLYEWDGVNGKYYGWYTTRGWNAKEPYLYLPFEEDTVGRKINPNHGFYNFKMMNIGLSDVDNDGGTDLLSYEPRVGWRYTKLPDFESDKHLLPSGGIWQEATAYNPKKHLIYCKLVDERDVDRVVLGSDSFSNEVFQNEGIVNDGHYFVNQARLIDLDEDEVPDYVVYEGLDWEHINRSGNEMVPFTPTADPIEAVSYMYCTSIGVFHIENTFLDFWVVDAQKIRTAIDLKQGEKYYFHSIPGQPGLSVIRRSDDGYEIYVEPDEKWKNLDLQNFPEFY